MLIFFHPALAPYRIDCFNAMNQHFVARFYFNYPNVQDQKFDQEYLRKQIEFEPIYLEKGFNIAGRSFRLGILSILRNEKPNILICSEFGQITLGSFLYYLISGRKFKMYTICDDSITNAKERKGLRAFFRNIISKNIDGVIYASREVGKWNIQNVSNRIKPLELPIIHRDQTFRTKLKESLPIAKKYIKKYGLDGKKIVLFVGRLVEVKNIPTLLNSFIKANTENTVLVIVGSGPLETELKQIVTDRDIQDKVVFPGRLEGDELHAWFALAHLFVLSSTYEQFGAVVNEALLAGSLVLCSNKAGAVTLINERNGDSFNPYDEDELTEKMEKILNSIDVLSYEELSIRKNNMPFTFDEKIDRLISNL
jgi:glycosyltransferase involved in cell wall biosynthesis